MNPIRQTIRAKCGCTQGLLPLRKAPRWWLVALILLPVLLVFVACRAKPKRLVLELAPGVDMEMVHVPAGDFLMGSMDHDEMAQSREKPQHTVHLDDYYIGKYEVTVREVRAFVRATDYETTADKEGWAWAWTGEMVEKVQGADWERVR